jgi:transposase
MRSDRSLRELWLTVPMMPKGLTGRAKGATRPTFRSRIGDTWAKLCGVALIEASSGKVTRHRLNRGGDRQANHALWRIVMTRMACHKPTKVYVARRIAEGKSKREIMRILKRYVAREVYHHLPRD